MSLELISLENPLWLQTLQKLRHDIYHLPEYVALESSRIKATPEAIAVIENEKILFVLYLLRKCKDVLTQEPTTQEIFDAVSPYGYPGILLSEAACTPEFIKSAIDQLTHVFRAKHVCSVFFRLHPILNHEFNEICKSNICQVSGETVSIDLRLSESEIWHQTRPEHRNKINKCKRNGLTTRIVPYHKHIDQFIEIYQETMDRVGAAKSYYFDYDYFLYLADALAEKLHLCIVEVDEEAICAGLFTECCRIVQYHLGGTRTEFLKQAPSKLMFDYVRFWAKERGNDFFHLGGGVGGAKDSLYHFKAGFSQQRHTFLTQRMIIDERQYFNLVESQAKSLNTEAEKLLKTNFFPAYRSSTVG